jgi:hypothetical protein
MAGPARHTGGWAWVTAYDRGASPTGSRGRRHERDDPIAAALRKSDQPTSFEVWCGNHNHRLAKVFDTGSKLLLVVRGSRVLASTWS